MSVTSSVSSFKDQCKCRVLCEDLSACLGYAQPKDWYRLNHCLSQCLADMCSMPPLYKGVKQSNAAAVQNGSMHASGGRERL